LHEDIPRTRHTASRVAGRDPEIWPSRLEALEVDAEGQFEVCLRRKISIREKQHSIERRAAGQRLRGPQSFLEIARHVLDRERLESLAQFDFVIRETREPPRRLAERDQAELLVGRQCRDEFAHFLFRRVESRKPAGFVERRHARGDIEQNRQALRPRRSTAQQRLHRRKDE
jgi:hypothetical protein